jgi:hypothetical protein
MEEPSGRRYVKMAPGRRYVKKDGSRALIKAAMREAINPMAGPLGLA